MSEEQKTCRFDLAWRGPCGHSPVNERGVCEKHAAFVCASCEQPAMRECDHTGIQFVCGAALCETCQHGIAPMDNPGLFNLGGGHVTKEVHERQLVAREAEWNDVRAGKATLKLSPVIEGGLTVSTPLIKEALPQPSEGA